MALLKKAAVPLLSAVVGGAIVASAIRLSPSIQALFVDDKASGERGSIYDDIIDKQDRIRDRFDRFFDDDFFTQRDPFEEMRKMRDQMERRMEKFGASPFTVNPFDSWFTEKFGGGSVNDISKREDDGFVYYDIKVRNLNSTSITTKIENGYITITGTVEEKDGDGEDGGHSSQRIFQSSFHRTFPLPDNVDQDKMEMVPENNKIVLKFPKNKV